MNKQKTLVIAGSTGVVIILLCLVWYGVMLAGFHRYLAQSGFREVRIQGFMPYFDGIVVGKLDAPQDNVHVEKLYIQGYPWQWHGKTPRRFYIRNLEWRSEGLSKSPIPWPFRRADTLNIEHITVHVPVLDETVVLTGDMRKAAKEPFLFTLDTRSDLVKTKLTGEVHARNKQIHVIDTEFHGAHWSNPLISTKRMSGWFSFSWNTQWHVMGEIESGFARTPDYRTYDNNLKISGPVDAVDFAFAANIEKTMQPIILDKVADTLAVRSYDERNVMPWTGLDDGFLAALKQVLDVQDAQHKDVEHIRLALKNAKKHSRRVLVDEAPPKPAKKEVKKDKSIVTKPETSSDSLVVEDTNILPQVTFNKLAQNSFFDGFFYTRALTVIPHACGQEHEKECWIARGQGGQLGYGLNGDVPSYFKRIRDVYEARALRKMLAQFEVQMLTMKGRGTTLETIDLKGYDSDRRLVHIELAIDDFE